MTDKRASSPPDFTQPSPTIVNALPDLLKARSQADFGVVSTDTTTDAVDANPGDGICASAAGECISFIPPQNTSCPCYFVHGQGEAGSALGTFANPGSNSVVLAAVDDGAAERVAGELRAFRDRNATRQRGAQIPLRVFVLPCTQVV